MAGERPFRACATADRVGDEAIAAPSDQSIFGTGISRRDLVAGAGGVTLAVALGGFLLHRSFSRALDADSAQACTLAPSTIGDGNERRGVNISFSRRGSGPPLLLLHGAGSSRRVWGPVVEILAERYDVLIPDLPGFGQSPPLGATPDVAGLTDAVASWLRDIGVERPHVVGNSLGGGIALELGFRGAARSVIALSPIGFWNTVEYAYLRVIIYASYELIRWVPLLASMIAKGEKPNLILGLFFFFFFAHPDDLPADDVRCAVEDMLRSQMLLDTIAACGSYRVQEHQTDIPMTIAWGADDRLLVGPQHLRARRILPGATHVLLPGCGHLCMADDPDLVAATIDKAVSVAAAPVGSALTRSLRSR
jgi:pimeloyl-ACP methyl ester carboxylesterase